MVAMELAPRGFIAGAQALQEIGRRVHPPTFTVRRDGSKASPEKTEERRQDQISKILPNWPNFYEGVGQSILMIAFTTLAPHLVNLGKFGNCVVLSVPTTRVRALLWLPAPLSSAFRLPSAFAVTLIHNYLYREILLLTFAIIGVLTFLMAAVSMFKILPMLINRPAGLSRGKVHFPRRAALLTLTIPAGLLAAVMIVFGRMSSDRELLALKASGVGLAPIVAPVIVHRDGSQHARLLARRLRRARVPEGIQWHEARDRDQQSDGVAESGGSHR